MVLILIFHILKGLIDVITLNGGIVGLILQNGNAVITLLFGLTNDLVCYLQSDLREF